MYIEQLRLDSRNLTLEELERFAYITGDARTSETIIRAIDEAADEANADAETRLQRELDDANDEAFEAQQENDRLHDAIDQVAAFLKSDKPISPAALKAAAQAMSDFDCSRGDAGERLAEALKAAQC